MLVLRRGRETTIRAERSRTARIPSSIARDSEIASWARSSGASGTIPDNRIPSGIARDSELPGVRTSIYTVGSNGEWSTGPTSLTIPVSDIDDYEYITIALWAGTNSGDKNVRTATVLRSIISASSDFEIVVRATAISVRRNTAGTSLTFAGTNQNVIDNGKIMGVWGGPF